MIILQISEMSLLLNGIPVSNQVKYSGINLPMMGKVRRTQKSIVKFHKYFKSGKNCGMNLQMKGGVRIRKTLF